MLDITRLISRAGRVLTGVDRVELAYLRCLLASEVPFFAIARTTLGYVLLDRDGAREIEARVSGKTEWGRRDVFTAFARSKPETVKRAESDLRRLSLSRSPSVLLGRMLSRHLPPGTAYLNAGHSNISERMLHAVHAELDGQVSVLLHDTIPLDFPQYQRPEIPARFEKLLRRVQAHADLVICNSGATRDSFLQHASDEIPVPQTVVAHLGVEPAQPDPDALPGDIDLSAPYFVAVGTIEPRKRYDVLLDFWEAREAPDCPRLYICGTRGWENEDVFRRLDRMGPGAPVRELNDLTDGALSALIEHATAMLFPSDAEGFGLPPVEAAALGTRVVCQNLPVFREVLGDIPVYATGTDRYLWGNIIERLIHDQAQDAKAANEQVLVPPSWEDHFNIVLKLT